MFGNKHENSETQTNPKKHTIFTKKKEKKRKESKKLKIRKIFGFARFLPKWFAISLDNASEAGEATPDIDR